MVISDLVMDKTLLRAELRFVLTTGGEQSVITCGMLRMLQLSVPSSDFLQEVKCSVKYIKSRLLKITSTILAD